MNMTVSIIVSLLAFVALVAMLRREKVSLGLPIAYLFALLLIHVPGAIAHLVGSDTLKDSIYTDIGIGFTAIGAVCFVAGVWAARWSRMRREEPQSANRLQFWWFCLVAGWFVTYGLSFLGRIPSIGAAVEKGGAVWMLGVMLGLRAAIRRRHPLWAAVWFSALAVYPVLMLLLGGFLSYGSTAIIIVLAMLTIATRSHVRVAIGVIATAVLSFNMFLSYFQHRDDIRDAVWGGAPLQERVDVAMDMFRDFAWFDLTNEQHLNSLDRRLNQNYFVGLAASRIRDKEVDYLYGRSLWEGAQALVPRLMWPDKPVVAGSPQIVAEMTGLLLPENTSWGVGNVMEFQINFGVPGVAVGFLVLGWLLGWLDRRAAAAEATGDLGRVFLYFLPAVALIQPNGSLVEMVGGPAAALVAAFGWRWAWNFRSRQFVAPSFDQVAVPYEDVPRRS
jgi:hypothetical protein